MSTRSERARRKRARWGLQGIANGFCQNCGEKGPHFVPPSLGEPGFYICESRVEPVPSANRTEEAKSDG